MADPVFFAPETSLSVEEIATLTGARPAAGADPALRDRRLAELAAVKGLSPAGDYVLTPAGEP